MAARVYSEETSGQPFEVSSMPTSKSGVMRMSIRSTRGASLFSAEVEAQSLQQIRWTGQPLQISDEVNVHYGLVSDDRDTRMGYVFEFNEGRNARSVIVPAKDIAWMLMDPDVQEVLLRR
jgi:hypothetical protein